jgi:hypothetical protein
MNSGNTVCGLPHSEIRESKPVFGYPRLIAVVHVLHRHSAPRHSLYALCSLTKNKRIFQRTKKEMGLTGLEPVTLRLSSACSNQLSYKPDNVRSTA